MEIIEELYKWQPYLEKLGASASGITIRKEGENVNQTFRFIQRADLIHYRVKGEPYEWVVDSAPQHTRH